MRDTAQNGELALLLEVAGTPKPGNVDRVHEYDDLRFEHFLAGAVGARPGLELAANGHPIGRSFERAVAGMAEQRGGNTQFGALLALIPLVATTAREALTANTVTSIVRQTTVDDAANFYRAFEHVDVAVTEPPAELEPLDVRRGTEAIQELRSRDLTLADIMDLSAEFDGIAAEWTSGFSRCFDAADTIQNGDGPITDRGVEIYLSLLADEVDTFVVTRNGRETAKEIKRRAGAVIDGREDLDEFANELVDRDINPGTTADMTAASLFIALERGLEI